MAKTIQITTRACAEFPALPVLFPAKASEYVCLSVKDTGCGIPPEIMPRIFEPFFTTKALSTKRGTGLGLSMVYELAKKLGAGIIVESVVNQGSIFTLILPVAPAGTDVGGFTAGKALRGEKEALEPVSPS
jgi:signal transduction histidine kinase